MAPTELFLRGMGIVYFLAFFSLWRELLGLYGSKGIVPIREFIQRLKRIRYPIWKMPTLFWIASSDAFLQTTAIVSMVLSVFVVLGALTPFALLLLWFFYLSFYTTGEPFLNFQWDGLLLECGFYAFLISLGPSFEAPMTWVLYFLLFRLMFSSAVVKWLAVTDYWRTRRAMDYHYESQPLPNIFAYFMHQQPRWFSSFSVYVVFFIEGVVPFLIFFGPQARLVAFIILLTFQWILILTGNFAFFNLLAIALCIPLLGLPSDLNDPFAWIVAIFLIAMNTLLALSPFISFKFFRNIFSFMNDYGLMASYGLFANMTKGRHEIIIEGSADGDAWIPYEFHHKPQKLDAYPTQVAPLQPRLEWQLWFIPSIPWNHVSWFVVLLERLLEGSKPVASLFKANPFPDRPPKYVRALIFAYKFTDLKTWRATGNYWQRTFLGAYTPPIQLNEKD